METTLTEKFEAFQKLVEHLRTDGDAIASSILLEDVKTGEAIPDSHLTKINKFTRMEQKKEDLYTYPVLMIDEAPTRNLVTYTAESQKKSINGWKGTTYLFNRLGTSTIFGQADHTLQAASQVARIYDARVVETPKGLVGSLGFVYTVRGTHETDDFIAKVDGGILKEVSIHVSVPGGVECSFCKDSFMNCKEKTGDYHYPGDRVDKKGKLTNSGKGELIVMSTGTGILVPLELSSVACPGSVNAHILQDDEVQNYKVVSLREALGGSREALDNIPQPPTEKEKPKMEKAEALLKLREIAMAAGVTLTMAIAKPENKELSEAAALSAEELAAAELEEAGKKCSECGHASHAGEECGVEDCDCDGPSSSQNEKPKFAIFEGFCPACQRDGSTESTSPVEDSVAVKTVKEEAAKTINTIVEAANAKNAEFKEKADQFDSLMKDFIESTVDLAIKSGSKKETDRKEYQETLSKLPYSAVKEIRELLTSTVPINTKEAQKKNLAVSMGERLKGQLGTTVVKTDNEGNKSAVNGTESVINRNPKRPLA